MTTTATSPAKVSWHTVTLRASGEPLRIAMHHIEGRAGKGPTLGLFSTSHGDEAYALLIIREVLRRIHPDRLKGSVLAVPVGNPVAFESFTRTTGQGMNTDKNNLNRVFPGTPDGWLTEQMAHVISREFVSRIDSLIDFHCGGLETAIDYILVEERDGEVGQRSVELAYTYGTDLLFFTPTAAHSGTLTQYAHSQGIPSVTAELGGCAYDRPGYLERCVRGTLNVMARLGMIDAEVETPERQMVMRRRTLLRPKNGGLFIPEAGFEKLGKSVPGGTVLARVVSAQTFEELEVLSAPFDSTVLIMMRGVLSRVSPGDYAYILGDGSSAEIRQTKLAAQGADA